MVNLLWKVTALECESFSISKRQFAAMSMTPAATPARPNHRRQAAFIASNGGAAAHGPMGSALIAARVIGYGA